MKTGVRWRCGLATLLLAAGASSASAQQPAAGAVVIEKPITTPYSPVGGGTPQAAPGMPPRNEPPHPTIEVVYPPARSVGATLGATQEVGPAAPPLGHEVLGDTPEKALPPGPAGAGIAQPRSFWQRFCSQMQDCFLGYPEEFREPPLGDRIYGNFKTQVANGDAARMVLYRYDFVDGTGALNHRGRERLAEIAAMLPRNFFPIVIEPDCLPGLDEARRLAILEELARCSFPIPPQRVVVGRPVANGLSGREAEIVYRNLLNQTFRQGISTGGATATPGAPSGVSPPTP